MIPNIELKLIGGRFDTSRHTCFFGVLGNDNGLAIRDEMLEWLEPLYNVITVTQEYPGVLFEWPALAIAQYYSLSHKVPVMYIHTKGAFYPNTRNGLQGAVRNMWKYEFSANAEKYWSAVSCERPTVACPYISDKCKITWWNAFVANPGAFGTIPVIEPSSNRFKYEILFKHSATSTVGVRSNNIMTGEETYEDIARFM